MTAPAGRGDFLSGPAAAAALVGDMGRSDAELLAASRRGEREAFGALVERYQGVVCAVTYSRTGDHALSEDVAQDTFIAAWRQLDQLREPGRLRQWLCGIARNLARKARRRSEREAPLAGAPAFEGANPFDQAAQAESERVVRDALMRVPDSYRDVLVLYYREQRAVRDVARVLGLTEAAVLQRLTRGRQYLADGVTDLVERSLRARIPRSIAALVLAALPAALPAPSRAEAAPHSHGGSMLKLSFAAAAVIAAGTTAYFVQRSPEPPAAAPAPAAHVAAAPAAVAPAHVRSAAISAPIAPALNAHPQAPGALPAVDELPKVDRATIERLKLTRGPARGPATAPVTIVAFTDNVCPYCGKSIATLDQLFEEYPGKLRLVIKQFPVHDTAMLAAEASFAADAQGKFWELHDLMFANQDDLSHDSLIALAGRAGLDVAGFRAALDNHTYADALNADIAAGKDLDVRGTPAFVINGRRVAGAWPVEDMRKVIDAALADAGVAKR